MIIKKYIEFIKEEKSPEKTFGEYVESLYEDEIVASMIAPYLVGTDPDVKLSNAIDVLPQDIQDELSTKIEKYLNGEEDNVNTIASVDINEDSSSPVYKPGKNIFNSFLNAMTSLGGKSLKIDYKSIPDNYLFYYEVKGFVPDIKSIVSRYKSLSKIGDIPDVTLDAYLYYGLRTVDNNIEYGWRDDKSFNQIGEFKLNKSALNWIKTHPSSSLSDLKKVVVNLEVKDIELFITIKKAMKEFNPGNYNEKSKAVIEDGKVIKFGFYGSGNWIKGKLDTNSYNEMRDLFKNFISKYKWSERTQIAIKHENFWVYFCFKIK